MIRDKKELLKYDDQTILKLIEPAESIIKDYCANELIYNYFAFVISTLYKENALWTNYTLENIYNESLEHLLNDIPKYSKLKYYKLNKILKDKYSISIKNKDPIKIEELKIN